MNSIQASEVCDVDLDAKNFTCPMPLLKAKMALNKMSAGQTLRVCATDPGSVRDFHSFASLSQHQLIYFVEHENYYEYIFQCQGKSPI